MTDNTKTFFGTTGAGILLDAVKANSLEDALPKIWDLANSTGEPFAHLWVICKETGEEWTI